MLLPCCLLRVFPGFSSKDGKLSPVNINATTIKVACSSCNLRELCMPMGISVEDLDRIDGMVATRRKVKRGASLFHNGEALYIHRRRA